MADPPPPEDDRRLAPALLMFAPERWGQVDRFRNLYGKTYRFAERDRRALTGVSGHFRKAEIFIDLAEELKPTLAIDRDELNNNGFTRAAHAHKLGAVVEGAILELYSSVDCTVQVLRAIYKKLTQGFRDDTRPFFQRIHQIDGLPEPLVAATVAATWFHELAILRADLVHSDTGRCDLDDETGIIGYVHYGVNKQGEFLRIPDIYVWLETMQAGVNLFLGHVFGFLMTTLSPESIEQMCGMTHGRMLMRRVFPAEPLTFDNGLCISHHWFEQPDAPTCPFVEQCGAYRHAKAIAATLEQPAGQKGPVSRGS